MNDGNMVMPYLVMKTGSDEGGVAIENTTKYLKENAFSKEVAEEIRTDLIQTIESPEGTAHSAKIEGVTLAGKTGTAETKSNKGEDAAEIGWFNCFIADPASEKQLLIVSMVENVENKGGSLYVVNKVSNLLKNM